jgi:hypothetical protein
MFLGLVGAVAAGSGFAAPNSSTADETLNLKNGRWWRKSNEYERIGYMEGFADAFQAASFFSGGDEEKRVKALYRLFTPVGASVGELEDALTKLYEDPANMRVGVPLLMQAASMKFGGSSAASVEKCLEALRAFSSSGS